MSGVVVEGFVTEEHCTSPHSVVAGVRDLAPKIGVIQRSTLACSRCCCGGGGDSLPVVDLKQPVVQHLSGLGKPALLPADPVTRNDDKVPANSVSLHRYNYLRRRFQGLPQ